VHRPGLTQIRHAAWSLFFILVAFTANPTIGAAAPAPPHPGSSLSAPPAPCATPPSLWASDLNGYGTITGYGGTPLVPLCVFGMGPGPGLASFLDDPRGLATDTPGTLYVADSNNFRVVRYTKTGVFLGAFLIPGHGTPYPDIPQSVCVAPKKPLIGVALTNINGLTGSVDVFDSAGTLLGSFTDANLKGANFCAFDRTGNLFVQGAGVSGGSFTWYVNRLQVHTVGGTLTVANIGTGWVGIHSSRSIPGTTISAASAPHVGPGCSSYCVDVRTWAVSGTVSASTPGGLTLTVLTTCTIMGYPSGSSPSVRQVAPDTSGNLFIGDWLNHKIERVASCNSGGTLQASTVNPATFPASVGIVRTYSVMAGFPLQTVVFPEQSYWGVATYPTGQF
jgi:hypothetical protein